MIVRLAPRPNILGCVVIHAVCWVEVGVHDMIGAAAAEADFCLLAAVNVFGASMDAKIIS